MALEITDANFEDVVFEIEQASISGFLVGNLVWSM